MSGKRPPPSRSPPPPPASAPPSPLVEQRVERPAAAAGNDDAAVNSAAGGTAIGTSATPAELPGDETLERAVVEQAAAAASAANNERSPSPPPRRNEKATYAPGQADAQPAVDHRQSAHIVEVDHYYGADGTGAHEDPDEAPPAYSEHLGEIANDNDGFGTNASVADDGRVNIRINQRTRRLSQIFAPALRSQLDLASEQEPPPPPYIPEHLGGAPGQVPPPPMNVVIHVVGSRGDVQPFVALGKVLKETYGHRVRLATHPVFNDFVTENGLEFFSIGGDPSELMAFMVKNPGLMPGFDTLRSGDVGKRRRSIAQMIRGAWRSCIEAGDGTGVEASDGSVEEWMSDGSSLWDSANPVKPFVADAIIANPPSFAHVHCAEKLGIPLHMMFTMPWSPTQQFPHPLANIQSTNADVSISNFMSYVLVDMLTWQGLGDVINRFRVHTLGLEPISLMWAPGMLARMRIPYTYCWSPALIPKPRDWASHISISGFYFLNLASNYTPAPDLAAFLDAGPPPVYIGFGSIVVDDPNAMTQLIFEAVRKTGQRALVSKGWGGLGVDELGVPDGVFMLGNVPHDWLFKRVSCVVHHGGAGTTAAGIAMGRPTVVVPFFGDQPFWGAMVHRAGAGPAPIPHKQLTAEKLAEAIQDALKPSSLDRAQELADKIKEEKGSDVGAQSFHQMLNVDKMRCSVLPGRTAVWRVKRTQVRLSPLAATVLANEGLLNFSELKIYTPRDYVIDDGPWDPVTGGAAALVGTASSMLMGVADFPIETLKALRIHPDTQKQVASSQAQAGSSSASQSAADGRSKAQKAVELPAGTPPSSLTSTTTEPTGSSISAVNPRLSVHSATSAESDSPNSSVVVSPVQSNDSSTAQPARRQSSLAQALSHARQRSRSGSGSRSRHESPSRPASSQRARSHADSLTGTGIGQDPPASGSQIIGTALGTGKGVSRIVGAGLKSPMDFTMGLSKGFHNLPKLYGEEVRQVDKVTGLNSGLRTAVKELGYGFFDGITGVFVQPYQGAKKEGAEGFVKGIGRGIAGAAVKPGAGLWALPGYAFKGVYKEVQKLYGASAQNYIIAARTAQGYEDWANSTAEERAEVLRKWNELLRDGGVKRKKNPGEEQLEIIQGLLDKHRQKRRERLKSKGKARLGERGEIRGNDSCSFLGNHFASRSTLNVPMPPSSPSLARDAPTPELDGREAESSRGPSAPASAVPYPSAEEEKYSVEKAQAAMEREQAARDAEAAELEEAIHQSIAAAQAARGGAGTQAEDEELERAIRESVAEMQQEAELRRRRAQVDEDADEEELERAIRESIAAAREQGADEAQARELEEALEKSLRLTKGKHTSDSEWDSSDEEDPEEAAVRDRQAEEEEEEVRRAVEESRKLQEEKEAAAAAAAGTTTGDDEAAAAAEEEEQLRRAMEESRLAHEAGQKDREEEEVVLNYIKRQSLAEEEHRRRMQDLRRQRTEKAGGTRAASAGQSGADSEDEDLRRALEMSVRREGQVGESSKSVAPALAVQEAEAEAQETGVIGGGGEGAGNVAPNGLPGANTNGEGGSGSAAQ
ncbi:hypothetical protein BDY21DRAFT_352518 [Lineolata rhizophorae]|uniref:Uncharacterized protein n=1 Tax=Lineolata rhizophorae TaxID=578093 RepID=A0A6A6NSK4_9PEZI|nr:hypothetical protein BDY21DRAFT_352518 [Lineolata rhizophorae]